jgi:pimeloyl-ACP methyl ester carboxylesterase
MNREMAKKIGIVLVLLLAIIIGASFYMLDYALSPDGNRRDVDSCYNQLFERYPDTQSWIDSLNRIGALRDTFVVMPTGERHHALYIHTGSPKTALIIHGWRNSAVTFLFLARLYERVLGGYNVVLPDLHAHGLSEGDMIQMGLLDSKDVRHWLTVFQTDTMVVHGVSMGGATTMMLSAEQMPKGIKDLRFVDDCGYTSAWDVFEGELKNQFGLPPFPLMYAASLLCKICYGWSFSEASAIEAVRRSSYPMLFIHGGADTFVPTEMVHRLYQAKSSNKRLWIAPGAIHARSYLAHPDEYTHQLSDFLKAKRHP